MTPEPEWLDQDVVLSIQDQQLDQHGGLEGIRDLGMLESALNRPLAKNHYQPDSTIFDLAAAYAYGVARNHPFADGNKRTAALASMLFLMVNGYEVTATLPEKYVIFMRLAAGDLTEDELAEWFKNNIKPIA